MQGQHGIYFTDSLSPSSRRVFLEHEPGKHPDLDVVELATLEKKIRDAGLELVASRQRIFGHYECHRCVSVASRALGRIERD